MKKIDLTEENIEQFIIENKEKFDTYNPPAIHARKFLVKMKTRLKRVVVSIVPHLLKVVVGVVVVWGISIAMWWIFNIPTLWGLLIRWINK